MSIFLFVVTAFLTIRTSVQALGEWQEDNKAPAICLFVMAASFVPLWLAIR
jgi:hypothetical protein